MGPSLLTQNLVLLLILRDDRVFIYMQRVLKHSSPRQPCNIELDVALDPLLNHIPSHV